MDPSSVLPVRGRLPVRSLTSAAAAALLFVVVAVPVGAQPLAASERGVLIPPVSLSADSVGLFDPVSALWYLRDASGATTSFAFGETGALPLFGDWDGDGVDTPGIYRPADGLVAFRNSNSSGVPNRAFFLPARAIVVAADTDGDGRDEIWTLHGDGWRADGRLAVGPVAGGYPRPVAGDFDGDGRATLAFFDRWNGEFLLPGEGSTLVIPYGSSQMEPVAGNFGWLPGADESPPRILGIPALVEGDEGPHVSMLQLELSRLGLYRGAIDGIYGTEVATSVIAFHKANLQERTGDWTEADSALLPSFEPDGVPDRPDEPDRVEVDITRQLLFLFLDGEVAAIVPVSSGGGYAYFSERQQAVVGAGTPRGDFTLWRYDKGWGCDSVTGWCVYNYWAFTTHYGVHGYRSVPAYPASHGCVRVNLWDADWLESQFSIGMPIHIWDEPPEVET